MTPDEFLSIMDNPNLISGIYNYCDRWCERCTKTDRCSVFLSTPQMDPEDFPDEDSFFKAVFQNLHNSFKLSLELLQRSANEKGIDLDAINDDPDLAEKEAARLAVKKSPISILAKEYVVVGHEWLKTCTDSLKALEESLQQADQMNLPNRNPEKEAAALRNALEVIAYYNSQIYTKLIRAQEGRLQDDAWFEVNDFPKDSDGSAKVALLGIDRSVQAWEVLWHHLPEQEDAILPILSLLNNLRGQTEVLFPEARDFKRPGFDE